MTQKLWSAKYRGGNIVATENGDGRDYLCLVPSFNGEGDSRAFVCHSSDLTDLTELEFHAKGSGVWIEGFTPAYLQDMADFAKHVCKTNGFQNSERDFRKLKAILAQLSEATVEPRFHSLDPEAQELGEISTCGLTGHLRGHCSCDYPSSAKVSVEPDDIKFLAHNLLAYNDSAKFPMPDVSERARKVLSLLTPAPMEEPRVGSVAQFGNMIWVHDGESETLPWLLIVARERTTWFSQTLTAKDSPND